MHSCLQVALPCGQDALFIKNSNERENMCARGEAVVLTLEASQCLA